MGFSAVMFGTYDGEDGVDSFFEMRISIEDDVIKFMYVLELLPGGREAFMQTFGRFCIALLKTFDQLIYILSG